MAKGNFPIYALNRGLISSLAMARTDLKRMGLSAAQQENFTPRVLGSAMLRPGLGYIDTTLSNAQALHLPFVKAATDTALIEFTNNTMRVRVSDAIISRPSVTTAITNGAFGSNITGWTTANESGGTSAWATGGYLSLVGNGFNRAITYQQITCSGGNISKEHGIAININRGRCKLRIGSTLGGDDYVAETELGAGVYSFSITPTGNFYIWFSNYGTAKAFVDSVAIEAAGDMLLSSPYVTADLSKIRFDESADVIYLAADGYDVMKIERRATRSWALVKFRPLDGPFRLGNFSPITITPSALNGDITLTASGNVFKSGHVGALFRLNADTQQVTQAFTATNQESTEVLVTGVDTTPSGTADTTHVDTGRNLGFYLDVTGTWSGTMKIQISVGGPGNWQDFTGGSITANVTNQFWNIGARYDNQLVYVRLVTDSLTWNSGTANVTITVPPRLGGASSGIVRILTVTSATSATASVVDALGALTATSDWAEGAWSTYRGYPTSVALHEGRLWWAGRSSIFASVSDAYESYDDTVIGDAGTINRTIGFGPVDVIAYLLSLQRMMIGTASAQISLRSSSIDDPITPTNFTMKGPSTQGCSNVPALKIDNRGIYVGISGDRIFQLGMDTQALFYDYASKEISILCPEQFKPTIVKLAVQRQPDTRIHALRSDGVVMVQVTDLAEEVEAWIKVTTNGTVEDIVVLPGAAEDQVYYVVNRTINGGTVRYLEKFALESECQGAALNKQADSFITYTGVATGTITAAHLKAATVVIWGDGKDLGTAVANASTGVVTIPNGVTAANIVVGLGYTAKFQSTKLAYAAQAGTALNQNKMITHVGLILENTHYQGIKYGQDFNHLWNLPPVEGGKATAADTIWSEFDSDTLETDAEWSTDSRLCLQAAAPRPCTILGVVIGVETHEKV